MSIVNEILSKAKLVPQLSANALALMKLVQDQDHSLQDVVRLVEVDAALTANVLKVVNAPAFGLGQPVSSLARAVAFLGDKMVVGIAIGSCAPEVYSKDLAGYDSPAGELWLHSLRTAIAARELTRLARTEISPETAFTAGILHDIGKSLISSYLQDRTGEVLDQVNTVTGADFLAAERKLLGVDHCQVGAAMAEHWNLPPELLAPIKRHHAPRSADLLLQPLTYTVHLADLLAMLGGSSTGADALAYAMDPGVEDHFDLSGSVLERVLLAVSDEFERSKTLFLG